MLWNKKQLCNSLEWWEMSGTCLVLIQLQADKTNSANFIVFGKPWKAYKREMKFYSVTVVFELLCIQLLNSHVISKLANVFPLNWFISNFWSISNLLWHSRRICINSLFLKGHPKHIRQNTQHFRFRLRFFATPRDLNTFCLILWTFFSPKLVRRVLIVLLKHKKYS